MLKNKILLLFILLTFCVGLEAKILYRVNGVVKKVDGKHIYIKSQNGNIILLKNRLSKSNLKKLSFINKKNIYTDVSLSSVKKTSNKSSINFKKEFAKLRRRRATRNK